MVFSLFAGTKLQRCSERSALFALAKLGTLFPYPLPRRSPLFYSVTADHPDADVEESGQQSEIYRTYRYATVEWYHRNENRHKEERNELLTERSLK